MIETETDEREEGKVGNKKEKKLDCILKRALWTNKNNSGEKNFVIATLVNKFLINIVL